MAGMEQVELEPIAGQGGEILTARLKEALNNANYQVVDRGSALQSASRENLARQTGGCRLAIRAGYGHNFAGKKFRRELNFTDDGLPKRPRLGDRFGVHGNARAYYDQILIVKCALAMTAGFDRNPLIEQCGNFFSELIFRLRIRDGNQRPS